MVHLLTASGALCTLFALIAIIDRHYVVVFLWLFLALFIDAIDGPLARLVDTKSHLPRFSGERLDLIIDYMNYVVLPALLVVSMPLIDGAPGYIAAGLILLTSLFHFSDLESKTTDGYFVGFPALWNVVIFYFLAFRITEMSAFAVVVFLSVMTFVPLRWLHPFRVCDLRWLTGVVLVAGSYAALATIISEFAPGMVEKVLLIGSVVYMLVLSFKRNIGSG